MPGLADVKVVPTCICFWLCSATIFGIIALPLSFKALPQGKYALELFWNTQQIGDVVTDPGMYFVGFGNMLVEYPSYFQTMYLVRDRTGIAEEEEDRDHPPIIRGALRARSADGLEMIVSVSFQWQLNPRSLKPLYAILGGGTIEESLYRDEFVRFARAAIVKSCANFQAPSFFTNRTLITMDMFEKVVAAFQRPDLGMDLIIQGLQLREVDLPDAFDQEIVRTQEQMQEIEVAYAEREEQRVAMTKDLRLAELKVAEVKQDSFGKAEKTRLENVAVVKQILVFQQRQAQANAEILSKFIGDSDPFGRLFEIMEIRALNAHNDTRLLINL